MALREFLDNGFFVYKNYFSDAELSQFERTVTDFYRMQALKIHEYRKELLSSDPPYETPLEEISYTYGTMEENDKEALYQVQKFLPQSPILRKLTERTGLLLDGHSPTTLIDGPGLFINRPHTYRLLYKWHSEEHYYPKRRNFVNVWFPLFDNKNKDNGTMSFKIGSHKRTYPFAEYKGYNKDSQNKANHFIQYEIPENFLTEFDTYHCEVKRGDMVAFHSNLVHRSNPNLSDKYSFAGVIRVWNPSQDLTLSGTLAVTPYGNDIGRPDLVVIP